MKIKIGGSELNIEGYEDLDTILEMYALKQDINPNKLRIIPDTKPFAETGRIDVESIDDYVRDLTEEEIERGNQLDRIVALFPKLKRRGVLLAWLEQLETPPLSYAFLEKYDRELTNKRAIDAAIRRDAENLPKVLKEVSIRINNKIQVFRSLRKFEPVGGSKLLVESTYSVASLELPNGEDLLDIFDAIRVSRDLPFVHLIAEDGKSYYKVYSLINPPDEWLDTMEGEEKSKKKEGKIRPEEPGIYMKVLNAPASYLDSRYSINTLYVDATWRVRGRLEYGTNLQFDVPESASLDIILSSVEGRVAYELIQTSQSHIKSSFSVPSFVLQRFIFADLVFLGPILNNFLFFNESVGTVLDKKRLFVYYQPNQSGDVANATTLIISSKFLEDFKGLEVRISKAPNVQIADSLRQVFLRLLEVYKTHQAEVYARYKPFVPKLESLMIKEDVKAKKDSRTGDRVKQLYQYKPDLFSERYPDQCQRGRQPKGLTPEEAKEAIERFGEHKVMNFPLNSDSWYSCEREADDPPDKAKFVWPGLQKTTNKIAKVKSKYPLIPCCFEDNQYTKAASKLGTYLTLAKEHGSSKKNPYWGTVEGIKEKTVKAVGTGYILGSHKSLPPKRLGLLPFLWTKILDLAPDIPKVKRQGNSVVAYMRRGVEQSPASFLYCLETAFNPDFAGMSAEEAANHIEEVKIKMSGLDLEYAKQELFEISEENIKLLLETKDTYLDAQILYSLAAYAYDCNIFLYITNEEEPNGAIAIPKASHAYITRSFDPSKPSVFDR